MDGSTRLPGWGDGPGGDRGCLGDRGKVTAVEWVPGFIPRLLAATLLSIAISISIFSITYHSEGVLLRSSVEPLASIAMDEAVTFPEHAWRPIGCVLPCLAYLASPRLPTAQFPSDEGTSAPRLP